MLKSSHPLEASYFYFLQKVNDDTAIPNTQRGMQSNRWAFAESARAE